MPFDGAGNFSRLYSWQADRDNGIRILAPRMDAEFDNFAAGMNQVFFRNGLVPMSGNFNLGQNALIGMSSGSINALSTRFADDPNTGVYLNGYGKYAIGVGGVRSAEFTSKGMSTPEVGSFGGLRVVPAINPQYLGQLPGPALEGYVAPDGGIAFFGPYNRTTNQYIPLTVAGSYVTLSPMGVEKLRVSDTAVNAIGALQQNGQQVWHAGNFNPSGLAPLASPQFTGMPGVKHNGDFTTTSPGISLFSGNEFYKIGWDGVGGTIGAIRYNLDAADVNHYHVFSAGIPGAETDLLYVRGDRAVIVPGTMYTNALEVVATATKVGGGAFAYQSQLGLSAAMSRGTATPVGGSDGDMYFQYV